MNIPVSDAIEAENRAVKEIMDLIRASMDASATEPLFFLQRLQTEIGHLPGAYVSYSTRDIEYAREIAKCLADEHGVPVPSDDDLQAALNEAGEDIEDMLLSDAIHEELVARLEALMEIAP